MVVLVERIFASHEYVLIILEKRGDLLPSEHHQPCAVAAGDGSAEPTLTLSYSLVVLGVDIAGPSTCLPELD